MQMEACARLPRAVSGAYGVMDQHYAVVHTVVCAVIRAEPGWAALVARHTAGPTVSATGGKSGIYVVQDVCGPCRDTSNDPGGTSVGCGCGSIRIDHGSADCSSRGGALDSLVTIKNIMFSPMATTIKAGTTITWKNLDAEPHTTVNDAGVFDAGLFHSYALDKDETFTYKFDKPGVYKVFCRIHPYMKETITVQ